MGMTMTTIGENEKEEKVPVKKCPPRRFDTALDQDAIARVMQGSVEVANFYNQISEKKQVHVHRMHESEKYKNRNYQYQPTLKKTNSMDKYFNKP